MSIEGYRNQGYVFVDDGSGKVVQQHRIVWEKHYGPIPEGWVIHHINGVKHDNRIENLKAMSVSEHNRLPDMPQTPPKKRRGPKKDLAPVQAIRAHCLKCMGGSKREVRTCTDTSCDLFKYRMGRNPHRKGIGGRPRKSKSMDIPTTKQRDVAKNEG